MNEQFEKIAKLKAEYEAAVKAVGKDGIQKLLAPLFEQYPNVAAIRWTQYTPYFNDGDVCTFRYDGNDIELLFTSDVVTKDSDDEFESPWSVRNDPVKPLIFDAFQEAMAIDDDIMLQAFGDHAQVTVTREGVEVEQYDHD